jgi:site-specific recombinase XerD
MTADKLKRLWDAIRREASKGGVDVRDVRIHDLRHTWGAMATSGGHALQVIGAVMGHRDPSTTIRYAHVAPSPAAKAVEETSARIAAALGGKKKKGAD